MVIPDPPGMMITEMPGGEWRYQIHSYLQRKLNSGQNITCMIEHRGLQEPQLLKLGRKVSLLLQTFIKHICVIPLNARLVLGAFS